MYVERVDVTKRVHEWTQEYRVRLAINLKLCVTFRKATSRNEMSRICKKTNFCVDILQNSDRLCVFFTLFWVFLQILAFHDLAPEHHQFQNNLKFSIIVNLSNSVLLHFLLLIWWILANCDGYLLKHDTNIWRNVTKYNWRVAICPQNSNTISQDIR